MSLKTVGLTVSLGVALLALSASETFAQGRGGAVAAPFGAAPAPFVRPGVPIGTKPFVPHHRRGFVGGPWPVAGGYYYGAPYSEPLAGSSLPPSNDVNINYTYKQDVPWDWAHRYPPAVAPSDRPYVPGCSSEPVTVSGNGGEQTVNVIRCY